jgi:hypothetical protein
MLDISGRTMTLKADVMVGSGVMITSNSTSNLMIEGMSSLSNPLTFNAGSTINDLSVDLSDAGANVQLMGTLGVNGMLKLMDGELMLQTGSALTMNSGSTIHIEDGTFNMGTGALVATASYNVEYMGGSATTNEEVMGGGLNNLTINLMAPTDMVTLGSDVTVGGMFSLLGGQLVLSSNDLTLNGNYDQNASATISGDANSSIALNIAPAINDTMYFDTVNNVLMNLTINIASGGTIVLGSDLRIANQLIFSSGKINLGDADLIIQSAATITGTDDTKYIVTGGYGKLTMRVNSAAPYVLFPIGNASSYSPASLQQTALGTSGNFMIGVVNDVYAAGYTGGSVAGSNSLVTKTWFIDAAPGVIVNMNLKLAWQSMSEVNGFDRTDAYISHYTAGSWDAMLGTPATTGPNSTYELIRGGVNDLNTSAFAVMDTTIASGISEHFSDDVHLYPNPSKDLVHFEISANTSEYTYELVDLTGKVLMKRQNHESKNAFDISGLENGYYFIRATNADSKEVITKRIIKM